LAAVKYDSTRDTLEHIDRVRVYLGKAMSDLWSRYYNHDRSKLDDIEKEAWDYATPLLKEHKYPSEEYRATLREIKPAIEHHYQMNDHHPEHFEDGILGMSLMGLLEMLADWKAASERSPDGDFLGSLTYNQERFKIPHELQAILLNTAKELGYIE
jgi:hypothetical protein